MLAASFFIQSLTFMPEECGKHRIAARIAPLSDRHLIYRNARNLVLWEVKKFSIGSNP